MLDHHGWLRSPADVRDASLYDYPNMSFDSDFAFETVAKGSDNQVVYGSLDWGFQIRSGVVRNEYRNPHALESAEFDKALERFRGYFAHEDVILYFDTDIATPRSGEDSKLADVPDYLSRYPDVQVEITGYADERGSDTHNSALSLNRATSVQALLVGMGVAASRIEVPIGMSETTAFAPGSPVAAPGSLTANRRVAVRFVRTASSLINAP
jgi:outer membrane protein OmpA-like peptidoglycan-associated protein